MNKSDKSDSEEESSSNPPKLVSLCDYDNSSSDEDREEVSSIEN